MSSNGVFLVDVSDLVVSAEDLPAIMAVLKHQKFLNRKYVGGNNGFAGGDYEYRYVTHAERDSIKIKPIEDSIWLYLNTFGKETK